jgi:hypothetical protein
MPCLQVLIVAQVQQIGKYAFDTPNTWDYNEDMSKRKNIQSKRENQRTHFSIIFDLSTRKRRIALHSRAVEVALPRTATV